VQPVSCPLTARGRHVASSALHFTQACPKTVEAHQENHKRKDKSKDKEKETKETVAAPLYSTSADAMKSGVGRNSDGPSPALLLLPLP